MQVEEFGLWFLFLPAGFMAGNFISGRIGNRFDQHHDHRRIIAERCDCSNDGSCLICWWPLNLCAGNPGFYVRHRPRHMFTLRSSGCHACNPALAGSASGAVTFFSTHVCWNFPTNLRFGRGLDMDTNCISHVCFLTDGISSCTLSPRLHHQNQVRFCLGLRLRDGSAK